MRKAFNIYRLRSAVALVVSLVLDVSVAGAAAPLQKLTFVFSGFNERTSFIFVAKDRHFFEEQGLEAQIVQVRNGPVAAGGLDLVHEATLLRPLETSGRACRAMPGSFLYER